MPSWAWRGLAALAGERVQRDRLLRRALRFAGRRSLLEEYMAVVVEIARLRPPAAPLAALVDSVLSHTRAIGLDSAVQRSLRPQINPVCRLAKNELGRHQAARVRALLVFPICRSVDGACLTRLDQ